MDPAMGVVGGALVARWSWRLLRDTGLVLLDRQAPDAVLQAITRAVEADGRFRLVDLHLWSIGPGYRAAIVSVQSSNPCDPLDVERLIPDDLAIAHVSIEVRPSGATSDDASS